MTSFDVTKHTPYDYEPNCQICHHSADECICPQCDVCGEAGNPSCINTHMSWKQWGHFFFQITEKEREQEIQRLKKEEELLDSLDNWATDLLL
jgi:hypothetical protein